MLVLLVGLAFLFFFLKCILLTMLLQLSQFFSPLSPPPPCIPTSSIPLLSSCPWIVQISSLASPFPILFLTVYFVPTYYASYSLYLFPLSSPSHSPLIPLHVIFCGSVPVLVVCLVFLGSVVHSCEFVVILLFIVFIFFFFLDNSL